ncbi:polysaccharide deacetylase family protein [Thermodesulfobacteriota bacterium]
MNVVLMYHRVVDAHFDPHNLAVSPKHFREHLKVLRKLTFPRRLQDVVDNWSNTNTDVAVTFDDGYADNLFEALPALETNDIPATIFLSTGMLDQDGFWIDRLARCLLGDHMYPDNVTLDIQGKDTHFDLRS